MSQPVYRIAKWAEVYETSESKRHKKLSWVSMPIDFGSNGYQSLVDEFGDDAPAMYGAWCALVGVAAQAPERGTLACSKGNPYTLTRIARMTCFPVEVFERLLDWGSRQGVEWVELASTTEPAQDSPRTDPAAAQDSPKVETKKSGLHYTTLPNNTKPTHTPTARASKKTTRGVTGFDSEWQRWLDFRESIDGRVMDPIQQDAVLMELERRGPEKAKRDIDFSILKGARSILDSDHDYQKPRAREPAEKAPKPKKLTDRLRAEGKYK